MFPTNEIENKVIEISETEDKVALDELAATFDIKLDRRKGFNKMVESFSEELGKLPKETWDTQEEKQEEVSEDDTEKNEPVPEGNDGEVVDQETSTDTVQEDSGTQETETKPDENLDTEDQPQTQELLSDYEFGENFKPAFNLAFKDRFLKIEYANVGYWVIDNIRDHRVIERQWSQEAISECRFEKEVATILYYISKYNKCTVRESRNSRFYTFTKTGAKLH